MLFIPVSLSLWCLSGCGEAEPGAPAAPAGVSSGLGGSGAAAPNLPMGAGGSGSVVGVAPGAAGSGPEAPPSVSGIAGGVASGGASNPSSASGGASQSGGTGGMPPVVLVSAPVFENCPAWPTATSNQNVGSTLEVSGTFDGGLRRFVGTGDLGSGDQDEGQDPLFTLSNGATLRNVILGSPAADGIHCEGSCTLENVWWEDVGEDAATFEGASGDTRVSIDCGGARAAADKVLQHNGGGTVVVRRFIVETFGKLYRSCGNCDDSFERHVELNDIIGRAPGTSLVGINENFGDTATLANIFLQDPTRSITVCERYQGNSNGDEPIRVGAGPDPLHCLYREPGDVTYVSQ